MHLLIKTPELCAKCQYNPVGDYCQEASCFECKNHYTVLAVKPEFRMPRCKCELIKHNEPCPYYKRKPKGETK